MSLLTILDRVNESDQKIYGSDVVAHLLKWYINEAAWNNNDSYEHWYVYYDRRGLFMHEFLAIADVLADEKIYG